MSKAQFHRPRGKAVPRGEAPLLDFMNEATAMVLREKPIRVRVQTPDWSYVWSLPAKPKRKRKARK